MRRHPDPCGSGSPLANPRRGWGEAWAVRNGFRLIAGLDEAGRGPWAGPVVAAAVVLTRQRFHVRIDDSKRLTPRQREHAFEAIHAQADVGVGIASHTIIDRDNILQATRRAMQAAIAQLQHAPQFLLVDGPFKPLSDIPQRNLIHGESQSVSIACASIVAKVTRDRLMRFYDRLFPEYGFAGHKGYGTEAHLASLKMHGPSPLHRCSFRPIAELLR